MLALARSVLQRRRARASPPRPRVLFYTDSTEVGGLDAHVSTLVNALGDRVAPIIVGTSADVVAALRSRCPRAPAELLPPVRDKRDLAGVAAHLRAVRRLRPDVLHASLPQPWSCQYAILGALLSPGTRVVTVEHAVIESSSRSQRILRRLLNRGVDAHFSVGERTARSIEALTGAAADSIGVIYNGVPDVPVRPLPRLRPEPTVGFVGRFWPEKGADTLIRAVAELPDVAAVLLGEGPQRASIESLATELGVADRVVLAGWRDDARDLLSTFDVFVLPSRRESFGISIVEAMLAERPVVATDVGSVSEVVVDGETGLLVAPDQPGALAHAIGALLEDPDRSRRMGARGREVALERFTPEAMADTFMSVYQGLLGENGRRGPAPRA